MAKTANAGTGQFGFGRVAGNEAGRRANARRMSDGRKIHTASGVEFVRQSYATEDVLVRVNVDRLNAAWSRDSHYLARGHVDERTRGFRDFLPRAQANRVPVVAARVSLSRDGSVDFANGRHRFSVLRDQGRATAFVSVHKNQAAAFQRRFG